MIRRPPRSTHCISSAASDVYKRQSKRNEATSPTCEISDLLPESHIIFWSQPFPLNPKPRSGVGTHADRDTGRAPGWPGTMTGSQYGSENWRALITDECSLAMPLGGTHGRSPSTHLNKRSTPAHKALPPSSPRKPSHPRAGAQYARGLPSYDQQGRQQARERLSLIHI